MTSISDLIGKVLIEIRESDDELLFTDSDEQVYRMWHSQDCCESVYIESIVGDLEDLIGSPICVAEEVTNSFSEGEPGKDELKPLDEYDESYTWTFYKLATIKGSVTIRWYGSSNGWYSERVDFEKI